MLLQMCWKLRWDSEDPALNNDSSPKTVTYKLFPIITFGNKVKSIELIAGKLCFNFLLVICSADVVGLKAGFQELTYGCRAEPHLAEVFEIGRLDGGGLDEVGLFRISVDCRGG